MVQIELNPYRCSECGKLLGYFIMTLGAEIKCPRCKELNMFSILPDPPTVEVLTDTPSYESVPSDEVVEVLTDVPEVVVLKE